MSRPLLVTLEYLPEHGGVASYLAGEVEAHGDVKVIRAQEHFWDKWPHWLPLLWRISPSFSRRGSGGGYDYLWVSHVLPIGYAALFWKLTRRIPYRVYLHGLDLVRPLQSPWKKFWVKTILENADEIVTNSNATRHLLLRYGIDSSRARISYPRIPKVDVRQYQSKAQELRQKHSIGSRPILLTISRLAKRKGIDVVLKALRQVWRNMPELVYVVIGDGEERETLELSARSGHVIFTGSAADDEKYGWLRACDLFILTPINDPNDFEGYGIVYKEAQMFGKPVIGSRVGGVPEAVGDGGVLISPGNIDQTAQAILKHVRP